MSKIIFINNDPNQLHLNYFLRKVAQKDDEVYYLRLLSDGLREKLSSDYPQREETELQKEYSHGTNWNPFLSETKVEFWNEAMQWLRSHPFERYIIEEMSEKCINVVSEADLAKSKVEILIADIHTLRSLDDYLAK